MRRAQLLHSPLLGVAVLPACPAAHPACWDHAGLHDTCIKTGKHLIGSSMCVGARGGGGYQVLAGLRQLLLAGAIVFSTNLDH